MNNPDTKLKSPKFWLWLGVINHSIALLVIAFGCAYSGFTCQGDDMKAVLSVYAFTIFTPQLALEVILLLAIFLVTRSLKDLSKSPLSLVLFTISASLLVIYTYSGV